MKNRLFAVLFCVIMVMALLPAATFAMERKSLIPLGTGGIDSPANSDAMFLLSDSTINATALTFGDVERGAIPAATNAAYTVAHYVMDTEGNFSGTATKTQNLSGAANATLTLSALKDTALEVENGIAYSHGEVNGSATTQTTVLPDGSLVIKLYYLREQHQLALAAGTGTETGGEATAQYYYGQSVVTNAFLSPGCTWDQWTSSNPELLSSSTVKNYSFHMPAGDVTLTANATPIQYSVRCAAAQHSSITGTNAYYTSAYSGTLVPDAGYALPQSITLTMGGLAFTDFSYADTTGNITIAAKKVLGNLVISGECTPIDYSVTYNTGGAAAISAGSYDIEDTAFTLPAAPTRANYRFAGWKVTASALGGTGFALNATLDATATAVTLSGCYGNVTLTARWTGDPYAVNYNANGGTGTMSPGTAAYGTAFKLPACSFTAPAGKRFKEWAIGSTTGTKVAAGGTYSFTAVTTVYAVWEDYVQHEIIAGQNGEWAKDATGSLGFTANADYSKFTGVSVDGTKISSDKYTSASGSTVVTLKASYLDTLSVGQHTLRVAFTDGFAETSFTIVAAAAIPATGDDAQPTLWLMIALLAGALLISSAVRRRRRQNG